MLEKNKLDRLNELARKKRCELISPEESEELETLRKEYLANFRNHFQDILDNTYIQDEKGDKTKLKKKCDYPDSIN